MTSVIHSDTVSEVHWPGLESVSSLEREEEKVEEGPSEGHQDSCGIKEERSATRNERGGLVHSAKEELSSNLLAAYNT